MQRLIYFLVITIVLFNCDSEEEKSLENHSIKVIAHRGMHNKYSENTIGAIDAAIEHNLDYVEIDVRTTKDGYLVLMHDGTVDRTTNGSGRVSHLSLEQIQSVVVKGNDGAGVTEERVPLLSEALRCMSGKIGAYVDIKDAEAKAVLDALTFFDMLEYSVIYSNETQLHKIKEIDPEARIMPEVDSEEDLNRVMSNLKPKIVAMSWHGFSEQLVAKIHNSNMKVFLDVLGLGDNPDGVRRAIAAGVDGIQSDNPEMVLQVITNELKQISQETQR